MSIRHLSEPSPRPLAERTLSVAALGKGRTKGFSLWSAAWAAMKGNRETGICFRGGSRAGPDLALVNWVVTVIAPVGAGVTVLGGIVSYQNHLRGLGRVVQSWSLSRGHAVGKTICRDYWGGVGGYLDPWRPRGSFDHGVRRIINVWDLATDQAIGKPLNNGTHVNALCAAELNGWAAIISADNEGRSESLMRQRECR